MSAHDDAVDSGRLEPLPRDEDGPVFAAPWQAQRKAAWADAYHHTPHGKPVELRRP